MGAPKQKWTSEEEEALRAGVAKHGTGKWKNIQKDPEFNTCLASRSNIDLKDKWRNMSVSASGQGSREKVRTPKPKNFAATPSSTQQTPSTTPSALDAATEAAMDTSKSPQEGKTAPRYTSLILEALAAMKDQGGSDVDAISGFIEQRQEVPPNFRRMLTTKLRRLVTQDKVEKVENLYKVKDASSGTRIPAPRLKEVRPRQQQNSMFGTFGNALEEASITTAYKIADAENKAYLAARAVEEAEKMVEWTGDTDLILQLAKEILEQCSRGEIILEA